MVNKILSSVGLLGLIATAVAAFEFLPVWAALFCLVAFGFVYIHFGNKIEYER